MALMISWVSSVPCPSLWLTLSTVVLVSVVVVVIIGVTSSVLGLFGWSLCKSSCVLVEVMVVFPGKFLCSSSSSGLLSVNDALPC